MTTEPSVLLSRVLRAERPGEEWRAEASALLAGLRPIETSEESDVRGEVRRLLVHRWGALADALLTSADPAMRRVALALAARLRPAPSTCGGSAVDLRRRCTRLCAEGRKLRRVPRAAHFLLFDALLDDDIEGWYRIVTFDGYCDAGRDERDALLVALLQRWSEALGLGSRRVLRRALAFTAFPGVFGGGDRGLRDLATHPVLAEPRDTGMSAPARGATDAPSTGVDGERYVAYLEELAAQDFLEALRDELSASTERRVFAFRDDDALCIGAGGFITTTSSYTLRLTDPPGGCFEVRTVLPLDETQRNRVRSYYPAARFTCWRYRELRWFERLRGRF